MTCEREVCKHLDTPPPNDPAIETENAHHFKRSIIEAEELIKKWERGGTKQYLLEIRRMMRKSAGLKE